MDWTGLMKHGLRKHGVIKHRLIKRGENCIYYLFTFTKEVLFHESLTALSATITRVTCGHWDACCMKWLH